MIGKEMPGSRVGVAIVGLGGAVATTAAAGIETLRRGINSKDGLPLADINISGLAGYEDLVFGGWDLNGQNLAVAASEHCVLTDDQLGKVGPELSQVRPWPAVASAAFCRRMDGANRRETDGHRTAVDAIIQDLARFKTENRLDSMVVINLASTERTPSDVPALRSIDAFERGLDDNDPSIGPAMLYARAAIEAGVPYANFTPSVAADAPALTEMAKRRGVPIAGKDGKTGQTMMKTVLAPAFRARALHVDGWFSTNILGNRDGLALEDPELAPLKAWD